MVMIPEVQTGAHASQATMKEVCNIYRNGKQLLLSRLACNFVSAKND
jgi:hypothetical protein